ncbi:MAG: glutamine--fructose-6-phosphate transaminase (isomerizing) [Candidatus Aenigmarchaeota archaeon]|nr:glutamine--fructose-6-phosphate transaminase (isomerizing) [Candidatus Aenigmarchaeota archaeon]MDW8159834.1 glutamine--fructose-6-phosphate transaminase (isomerizing) [Candidatus Aenigmarchaeota archaeon]
MCGIMGYVGNGNGIHATLVGLKRLEYRGYDSVGVGYKKGGDLVIKKCVGRVEDICRRLIPSEDHSTIVISHTRWGTHGKITDENAHPHADCQGKIAIVHNGIIENFQDIKEFLSKRGHQFKSETDSEVISHLIEEYLKTENSFEEACKKAFSMLKGSFAILALASGEDKIVGIRKDSPLVVGIKENESFIASDIYALLPFTKEFIFLQNYDFITVGKGVVKIENLKEGKVERPVEVIDINLEYDGKEKYHHFMIKEIMEQSEVIDRILEKNNGKIEVFSKEISSAKKVFLVGAGSSYHACLYGSYLLTKAGIDSKPIVASEFKHFEKLIDKDSLVIAVSQSGETADVIEAIRIAKKRGAKIFSIVNVYGSTVMRESNDYILMNVGFEVGVAATKTFTSQLIIFLLIYKSIMGEGFDGRELQSKILDLLGRSRREFMEKVVDYLKEKDHVFLIGRGLSFISAEEAALKIKEVSYIHAEAFPGGELKHGTLALIENGTPCIVFVDRENKDEILSNAHEVKTRGGFIIGISPERDEVFDIWIKIPEANEELTIMQVIPIQILAYLLALKKGYNPDYPRNLAKSVTVK